MICSNFLRVIFIKAPLVLVVAGKTQADDRDGNFQGPNSFDADSFALTRFGTETFWFRDASTRRYFGADTF